MSLLNRIAGVALASVLLVTPALAENKKVVLSQAFQSMLYLPLYVAIDEGFFTQQGLDLTKETAGAPTVALSAVITLLLGLLILARWPINSVYILGLFLGIDLIVAGAGWIGLGFGLHRERAQPQA